MKPSFSLAAAVLTICIVLVGPPESASQGTSLEYQVKAAYLFNFSKFVEWPRQAFPRSDAPFTLCLAGDPFEGVLDKTIQGETLNGRPLVVRRLTGADGVAGCHLIYVARSEGRRSAEFIGAAAKMPILTVGESEEFINNGGMVRFIETGHRIRFEINPDAAERVSLRVSSRLLRLADIVRQRAGNQ